MFLRTGLVLTSFLFLASQLLAQTMTVSKRHSTMGYPIQEGYEWELGGSTLPITFLYNNGKTTIDHGTVNFFVKNETKNGPKEKVTVSIGQRRNWVATKYYISDPGQYTVSISLPGREHEVLASTKFTVKGRKAVAIMESRPESEQKPDTPTPVDEKDPPKEDSEKTVEQPEASSNKSVAIADLMEMNSKVITELPGIKLDLPEIELVEDEKVAKEFEHMFIQFGRKIENGMLMGQNEKFKLVEGGTPIVSSFSHTKPFDTKMIGVSVWLKPKGTREFSVHFDEIKIPVKPTDRTATFDILFTHPGYYRFELYNEDLIKIREVTVWIYQH